MARFDLTDFEWSVIQPLLPQKLRGVPRVDDHRVLNGIFWRLRTGAPWADIPARYGPHTTCVNRFNRWRKAGVWAMLLEAVSGAFEGDVQMIDSSSIRVHQHAANGQKNRPIPLHGSLAGRPDDQDPCARRRALGRPIRLKLTEGQAHDGRSAADMFDTVEAGDILLADRAYDSDELRDRLAARGAGGNIRPMPNRVRHPVFSPWVYRQRNAVERFFNKLKHFRAIATRYDKRDDNYLASVQLAPMRIWLRSYESVT